MYVLWYLFQLEQILANGPLPISMTLVLFVRVFTALLGCVFNITLIYITYNQKNLHGICNILICLNAFFNLLFQTGYAVWPVLLVSGIRLIKLSICLYFQILPSIGSAANVSILLFIALDRLLCIANPGRYAKMNKQIYLGIIIVIVTAYSSLNASLTYQFVLMNPDKKVPCTISDCASPGINNFVLFINLACCVCYTVMWTVLKTSLWGSKMRDKATQRIFKSLVMILVVTVMPWAVYMLFKTSLAYIKLSALELWYAGSIIGYGIIFASTADILILYTFSTEYKAAIKRQFLKSYVTPGSKMTQVKSHIKSSITKT